MATQQMTRSMVKELRTRMQALLNDFAGLNVKVGNASYTDGSCTFKVECAVVAANGVVVTKEATAFERYANGYGLLGVSLGDKFTSKGRTFEITGLNTRARRMPVQAKDRSGRGYKFTVEAVTRALNPTTVVAGMRFGAGR